MPKSERAQSRSWRGSGTRSCSVSSNCGPSVPLHVPLQLSKSAPGNRMPQQRGSVDTATTTAAKEVNKPKPLPAPNSDFYHLAETLSADELAVLKKVRAFMESKVASIINKYWVEDAFPFELLPAFK